MKMRIALLMSGGMAAIFWSGQAHATDAFNLIGHGPRSVAMGGTGAAYDIGLAGMMINPATLGLLPQGRHYSLGLDVITADLELRNLSTGEVAKSHDRGRNNGPYYAPELAFGWSGGRYAFGVGAFAASGVGTQYGSDSFVSRTVVNGVDTGLDNYSRLLSLRVPIAASYQVTDKLTVGGSVEAVWTAVNLGLLLDASQLGALAADGRMSGSLLPTLLSVPDLSAGYLEFDNGEIAGGEADAWGVAGRIGLTYQASARTRIGVVYAFKTDAPDLKGRATLTAVSASLGGIPLDGAVRLRDFQLPAQVTVGVSHEVNDRLSVAFDYKRVFWSDAMKDIDVGFEQAGAGAAIDLALPFNYRDTNVYALGAAYRVDERWTVRGGFHYADQAAPDAGVMAVIPSTPTTNLTAGVSYALGETGAIDVGLAYGFRDKTTNDDLPITSRPVETRHGQVALSLALTRRF
jgi:long-chain fatty acid transport protein